ncbi:hypothetical protein DCAR_0205986 [Daucus carota subsp. sativus]|uniref:CCHC-type domain-containing protein n=1 Tax=Daucus carota subsp. sativus TaxID=79200 RepID=A0AAF0WEQ0_DAUCS|nr:PREDICTED: uncharacterized protein At4g02000-like [Daucus carota subsp. sativus]WOG86768.1 hypothetical protein DCAR_0205986 [Daucus carota subsp. sativus]
MEKSKASLEEMCARLVLEDEEGEEILVGEEEVVKTKESFILVGRFLTDKNINFPAMQHVLSSLWRPREGVEIHDLGIGRYSFVFYHILELQKVIDGAPWNFEQSLLVFHKLETDDPNVVALDRMDIWVQVYDIPLRMLTEKIVQSIGNLVGTFVKMDPTTLNGLWKQYIRIRVTMDIKKPLKRRMKLKREGGSSSWINYKYERLSMFCFVCGRLGHSDRDCEIVYANPEKMVEWAYGVWLRAPTKNTRMQKMGSKWLRNGPDGVRSWQVGNNHGGGVDVAVRFMETGGVVSEIPRVC